MEDNIDCISVNHKKSVQFKLNLSFYADIVLFQINMNIVFTTLGTNIVMIHGCQQYTHDMYKSINCIQKTINYK